MAGTQNVTFSHAQVAEALVKYHDLHEGLWGLYIEFGIAAGNVGPTPEDLRPAAIVPIVKIGLQTFDKPNSMTVDAAAVNPAKKRQAKK